MRTTLTSMFLTALSIIFYHFKMINNLDATIIGCLMILTPGIAITTAIALGVGLMRILMKGMI